MKRLSLLLAVVPLLCVPSARAALDAHSYVQRGLVACYDGIDNAGTGTHDAITATWADLSGNGFDGTLGTNVAWVANGWTNNADGQPVTIPEGTVSAVTGSGSFTVQFACVPTRANVREAFFSQYDNNTRGGTISVEHNDGGSSTGRLRLYRDNGFGGNSFSYLAPLVLPSGDFASVSVAVGALSETFWLNGTTAHTNDTQFGLAQTRCPSVIGGEPYREGMAFHGTYHAFRLYNRALSDDEAKVNAAVDAIRFDGALPNDFVLGGGYSFDADGDLCATVSAASGGTGGGTGGTVSVDGGAAGASASATVKQYGTVVLVAEPAEGYVFQRWEGDVDAISSGSTTDASIVVTASSAAHLVASFRTDASGGGEVVIPSDGLTSRSYVQRGLVAQYDGIDNAGFDEHDDDATTWVDLTGNGNTGTLGANVAWTANGWINDADGQPVSVGNGLSATTSSGTYTAEFACTPSRTSTRECFFSQYGEGAAAVDGALALEHNSGANSSGNLRYFLLRTGAIQSVDILSSVTILADEFASVSMAVTPALRVFRRNGAAAYTNTTEVAIVPADCRSVIGGDPSRPAMAFHGSYNAFRLYDCALTEEESEVNAAVDAIRFDGASPNDFELRGGYSFGLDGSLWVTVTGESAGLNGGAAGGTVSVADGAAGASASESVPQYETVALTATPAPGFLFIGWEGDTAAIVSGTASDASVVVEAGWSVRLRAVFAARKIGLDARSYVQRGLVACYDGVDNTGTGTHDATAATWADLTGHGNDGSLGANVTWGAYGWVNSSDGKPVTVAPGGITQVSSVSRTTGSRTFTAQFSVTPSRNNARQTFWGQYSSKGFSVEHNNSSARSGLIRFYGNGNSVTDRSFSDITVEANEWASLSVSVSPTNQIVWKNGATTSTNNATLSGGYATDCTTVIGGENYRENMAFQGIYHAFRLYDRVLTADEIKVNAAVDAVRFGGKTTAQVSPLPDGWSFDDDGTLFVTLSATAGRGGRVRLGNGAADRAVSAIVNQDGLDIVTFIAVPITGFAFVCWEGDTQWIESGTAETAEIVVDSTGPATLVATFVKVFDPPTAIIVR